MARTKQLSRCGTYYHPASGHGKFKPRPTTGGVKKRKASKPKKKRTHKKKKKSKRKLKGGSFFGNMVANML
jgi:hypothetical protein